MSASWNIGSQTTVVGPEMQADLYSIITGLLSLIDIDEHFK